MPTLQEMSFTCLVSITVCLTVLIALRALGWTEYSLPIAAGAAGVASGVVSMRRRSNGRGESAAT